jgi:hypothetical protein
MGLLKLIDNFKKLSVEQVAEESFTEVKEHAIDEQKAQMLEGKSSEGEIIGRYRNKSYAIIKHELNPLAGLGNVDLRLFGNYSKGITLTIESGKATFNSTDEKAGKLAEKYGEDLIYGLNIDHKSKFIREFLKPVFIKNIRNKVGL